MYKQRLVLLIAIGTMVLSGCANLDFRSREREATSSSLVDYLYPDGQVPENIVDAKPVLELPLRVGIAFIPEARNNYRVSALTEKQKSALLDNVKQQFETYPFIEHIEVIPEIYLSSKKGFTALQQVSRLYGVDVIALVSYDQVGFHSNNMSSFLYLTIIGAFTVPGDSHRIDTFVDTAVFDVRTKKLLFRAPGVDTREKLATMIDSEDALSRVSQASFDSAMKNMTTNLNTELTNFKGRLKQGEVAEIKYKAGYTGGGSTDLYIIVALMSLLFVGYARRHSKSQ